MTDLASRLSRERMETVAALEAVICAAAAPDRPETTASVLEVLAELVTAKRAELDELSVRQTRLTMEVAAAERTMTAGEQRAAAAADRSRRGERRTANSARLLAQAQHRRRSLLTEVDQLTRDFDAPESAAASPVKGTSSAHLSPSCAVHSPSVARATVDSLRRAADPAPALDAMATARAAANAFHRRQTAVEAARREFLSLRRSNDIIEAQVQALAAGGSKADKVYARLSTV